MSDKNYVSLVDLRSDLRVEHRIKDGTDYSIIERQGGRILTCHAAFFETILEAARRHGVTFKAAFMYDERNW